jgi:hypothetical protein
MKRKPINDLNKVNGSFNKQKCRGALPFKSLEGDGKRK